MTARARLAIERRRRAVGCWWRRSALVVITMTGGGLCLPAPVARAARVARVQVVGAVPGVVDVGARVRLYGKVVGLQRPAHIGLEVRVGHRWKQIASAAVRAFSPFYVLTWRTPTQPSSTVVRLVVSIGAQAVATTRATRVTVRIQPPATPLPTPSRQPPGVTIAGPLTTVTGVRNDYAITVVPPRSAVRGAVVIFAALADCHVYDNQLTLTQGQPMVIPFWAIFTSTTASHPIWPVGPGNTEVPSGIEVREVGDGGPVAVYFADVNFPTAVTAPMAGLARIARVQGGGPTCGIGQ
jgi:hypothetical protein